MSSFTLAHASDWHATTLTGVRPGELVNKRFLGWLSWIYRRRNTHRPEILRALFEDVQALAPDHVAITGDLTNVALEREFVEAAGLLRELGEPAWVSLVPGNHDAYVSVARAVAWDLWSHYMASDEAREAAAISDSVPQAPVPVHFPAVRIRGPVALVGVCTAVPTPPGFASGEVGTEQLDALAGKLEKLREQGLCRVVLTHHPVIDDGYTPRRRLSDSAGLRSVLEAAGAELVLHGHGHRRQIGRLAGPEEEIPCIGVRSASHVAEPDDRRAQYHLFRIEREGQGFRIALRTRGYAVETSRFVDEGELEL